MMTLGLKSNVNRLDAYFDCCIDCPGIGPGISWSADLGEAVERLLLIVHLARQAPCVIYMHFLDHHMWF